MTARVGVITFPGTLDDVDAARAVRLAGAEAVSLWHADADLKGVDAVVVPGGFSYGDYLRCWRDRQVRPGDGRSGRGCRTGHAGVGDLQRFSGAVRGGSAARRVDPQRRVCTSSAAICGSRSRRIRRRGRSRYELGRRPAGAAEVRGGPLRRQRRSARRTGGRGPRGVPLPRQPQRLACATSPGSARPTAASSV